MNFTSHQLLLMSLFAPLCLVSAGVVEPASAKPNGSKLQTHAIKVSTRVIKSFAKSGGRRNKFGQLKFRGGLVLKSGDAAFGGFSGLEISPDGKTILAVSDAGAWLKAKLAYNGNRPILIGKATIGPIKALAGRRLLRGRDRDAEAVRLYKGNLETGTLLIGFEINHRIGFFGLQDGQLKPPLRYLRPPVRLKRNKSIEATAVVRKGRFKQAVVAFAERSLDGNGHHRGWLWHRPGSADGKRRANQRLASKRANQRIRQRERVYPLAVTNIGGFDITDATGAFDGGLYILERRFRWSEGVKMRIRKIAPEQIKPGAVLTGETLIEADLGYEIDNMEGLALHRDKGGRSVLTLISDDNFNSFLQRTLLLQFALDK